MSTPQPISTTQDTPDPDGRWQALAVLGTAMVLSMATWFSASAILPALRQQWGLSVSAASWLTIAVQLGFVAGALVSAFFGLADTIRPRTMIFAGTLIAAAANAGLLFVSGSAGAITLRFITGAALAGVYPSALKGMSTWFRVGRGTALGVMVGALTLGSALPHLINGFGGLEWRTVIVTTSVLTVAGGLLAQLTFREGPFTFPTAVFSPREIGRLARDRGVRLASIGYFGHMWELYAMWAWFAAFATDTLSLHGVADPANTASLLAFAVIGIGAVGCIAGGILGDRWGRTRTTAAAMAVSGTCALFIGTLRNAPLPLLIAVSLIWGFTVVADSAQFSAIVTEVADQAYVGTAVTLQLAIGFTLTVATIWLVPVLRDGPGWGWAFVLLVPGPLLGVIAMLRLKSLPEAKMIAGGRG
ncbi:MAG: MFS transporter [Actinobacteria bacterium]|nr:MAG: MFS transporter [Actinomycetota bacterium]